MRKNIKDLLISMGFKIHGDIAQHRVFGIITCEEKTTVEDVAHKLYECGKHAKAEEIKKALNLR